MLVNFTVSLDSDAGLLVLIFTAMSDHSLTVFENFMPDWLPVTLGLSLSSTVLENFSWGRIFWKY